MLLSDMLLALIFAFPPRTTRAMGSFEQHVWKASSSCPTSRLVPLHADGCAFRQHSFSSATMWLSTMVRNKEEAVTQKQVLLLLTAVNLAFMPMGQSQERTPSLKKAAEFDLPGPPGKRFDYLAIDPDDQYLISAHLAAGQTYVIDLRTNKVVATVTDTPGAEGVEYVPELKKFYTSNAGDNTIGVVDMRQMKVVKKLRTERKPDGSAYAAPFHKLYVSDERGKAEAVVDVTKDEIVKTLHFNSETGMPQYDPVARKVYVNLQDENIFAVIDPATDEVVGRYSVGRCKGNHGMTLDPERHRAFLSCEENNLMTVLDLDKHGPIAYLPMADGPDVIKFDPGLSRIYVACYSGAISVFHQDDPQHYRKLEDSKVQHAVHSLAVDPETHRVYTPEQEEDGKPVARMIVYEAVTGK
jgi:DNA-binding beta-propeller fold protein YncE